MKRLMVCIWIGIFVVLALGACQANDDSNRVNGTPDASDAATAFSAKGVAVHRYADVQAGVVCWVFYHKFYNVVAMSCLPEAQVTPAPAIWGPGPQ
jgi:predicted secreted protein